MSPGLLLLLNLDATCGQFGVRCNWLHLGIRVWRLVEIFRGLLLQGYLRRCDVERRVALRLIDSAHHGLKVVFLLATTACILCS